jgi:hypothetical protein
VIPRNRHLTDPQSLNAYSYSDDNPIVKSDPSGKQYLELAEDAITLTNEADAYINEAFTTESSVTVSNTPAQGPMFTYNEFPAQESLQASVGWPTEMPGETSPLTWHTGDGWAVTTPLTAITLILIGDVKDNREQYKKDIEPLKGSANAMSSSPGTGYPNGIPHTQTASYSATIGAGRPQAYISAQHGASPANNSSSGNSSGSSGSGTVNWGVVGSGSFNPFLPHMSGH